ncbi:MAG: endopeptidase La [Deltaproteobacteria bacterium HGW-Deltaproteobacteria-15]|jgi:ATP-dependent Lon protease|nr:MAG: endopeptidase La [Deltaproteobacteria bacterium HGW-Deltaproteobacteria-15]
MHSKGEKYVEGILPVLPVKDTVVFPNMVVPVLIKTNKYLPMVQEASGTDKMLFVISSSGNGKEGQDIDEFPPVGTVCRISKLSREKEGTVVVVQGLSRGSVTEVISRDPFQKVKVKGIADVETIGPRIDALKASLLKQFAELVQISPNLPDEVLRLCRHVEDPSTLADMVAAYSNISRESKQEILESVDVEKRIEDLIVIVNQQLEIARMGQQIQSQVQKGIDKNQREYLLREQLKAIQRELGVDEQGSQEIQELRKRLEKKKLPESAYKVAAKEIAKVGKMNPSSSEYTVSMNYIDLLLELPWSESTRDSIDLRKAERVLNTHHYDLEKVKKRILEYLAVRKLNPAHKGPILCFYGPPGTGKTSLGRSIAESMGRKFVRISLGGVRDEAEIRGHRRTYVGALPGRIIHGLKKAGANNPVFMLDEIDKLGKDFRGDPSSALLEVLDPEQNYSFSDHYLEVEFDLSKVMFITTANQLDTIPRALLDRMEVLELPGYTEYEKLHIAEKFLIPRQVKEHGLSNRRVTFEKEAIQKIAREYAREAGVRNLEREIGAVCRGVARKVATNHHGRFTVGPDDLKGYLGYPKHTQEVAERTSVPGVATGMAWTPTGGDILFVEATSMPGRKSLVLTGQLGEVMKESAQAALSYLRSKAGSFGIQEDFFSDHDLHIHVPAGAIPKDGPSAGVTILSALASLLTCRPIKSDVAMTGEVTLRGAVLPVGGIKEKVLAANRNGIKHIILPERNKGDLEEIPEEVKGSITFHLVKKMEEVLDIALDAPVGASCN